MNISVELRVPENVWTPPAVKPLDVELWQAWLAKGRAQDRRRIGRFITGVTWVTIAGLLAAVGHWPHPVAFDLVIRFVVAAGALRLIFHALGSRSYVVAAVLGALVLLYNPGAPVFGFSGAWRSALVVASAVPFVVSLAWRTPRMEPNA